MIGSASPHQRTILATVLAGALILAALWLLAISPKRSESAVVRDNVTAQEARLSAAKAQVAQYEAARQHYPRDKAALRRLDEAVPGRGEISTLLRQLQRRAKARKSLLNLAQLKPGSPTAPVAAPVATSANAATAASSTATTTAPAPAAPSGTLTPGAVIGGPGGLATLPFTFTYTGRYFDLVKVLKAARNSVTVHSGHLRIDGRLVTIEGISFARTTPTSPQITASVSGTAYIAAAPPTPPTAAAATTTGGS